MPVATVNEYSDLLSCERDVNPSSSIPWYGKLKSIPQTHAVKLPDVVRARVRCRRVRASPSFARGHLPARREMVRHSSWRCGFLVKLADVEGCQMAGRSFCPVGSKRVLRTPG